MTLALRKLVMPALLVLSAGVVAAAPAAPRAHPLLRQAPEAPIPAARTQADGSSVRFAVLGDYGLAGEAEADVAGLIAGWAPDLVLTTGDNNYIEGSALTIDANIGQYFSAFIYPYVGSYGTGASENRFFPSLGNHDWWAPSAQPYLDYFTLPGNERYYDFAWGPVHFFCLDSDPAEPDGITSTSMQALWLQNALAESTQAWNVVYFHQAPYSSGLHGSSVELRWPFEAWGADAVLAAHDHTYERLTVGAIPYFVDGLGGRSIYGFGTPLPESEFRYNADYGAMLVEASEEKIVYRFYNRSGLLIDRVVQTPTGLLRPDTIGTRRQDVFYLRAANTTGYADLHFTYGYPTDNRPIVGDWDGDGVDTGGLFRDGEFYLRNSNSSGYADIKYGFGLAADLPIAGDWDGDGIDTVGVYRNGVVYLKSDHSPSGPFLTYKYGIAGDLPIAGDWDDDGIDTLGVYRNGVVYLRNSNTTGYADVKFGYGIPGDLPVAGDWDADGVDSVGAYRQGVFYLRNALSTGYADLKFGYGVPGDIPIAGRWGIPSP